MNEGTTQDTVNQLEDEISELLKMEDDDERETEKGCRILGVEVIRTLEIQTNARNHKGVTVLLVGELDDRNGLHNLKARCGYEDFQIASDSPFWAFAEDIAQGITEGF